MRVFITGASSGIGEALAREYAAQGASLGLVARRADQLERLRADLLQYFPAPEHEPHHIYVADVTDHAALQAAAQDFAARGPVDVVIANAGISAGTLTEDAEDLKVFARVHAVNVLGMVATFQPFIVPMREALLASQKSSNAPMSEKPKNAEKMPRTAFSVPFQPKLVGIASVAGIRGLPGSGAYSSSKAAAIAYLESLRVELRGSGIRVVTIAPGYIRTPLTSKNPYAMPFLMSPENFAARAVKAIQRGVSYRVIPWQMGVVAKLLRALPNFVFDRALAKAKRKPRASELGDLAK